MRRWVPIALLVTAVLAAGCGDGDTDDAAPGDGAAEEATTAPDVAVSCPDYERVLALFAQAEEVATGSFDGQTQADQALADAVAELGRSAEGDDELTAALDTLGQVSFQVSESASGPLPEAVDGALDTITEAWGDACRSAVATTTG